MIAVTFALPAESSKFVALLQNRRRTHVANIPVVRGLLGANAVAVIHTGVGASACRARLTPVLAAEKFRLLVSAGFAGALDPALAVGEIVLAQNYSAPELLRAAQSRLTSYEPRTGKLITTEEVVEGNTRPEIARRTGACAAEMETETIAELCRGAGLPLLSLRAISDTIAHGFPAPAEVLFDRATQRTSALRLINYLLRNPAAIRPLIRFSGQIGNARARLTSALETFLRAEITWPP